MLVVIQTPNDSQDDTHVQPYNRGSVPCVNLGKMNKIPTRDIEAGAVFSEINTDVSTKNYLPEVVLDHHAVCNKAVTIAIQI